MNRTAIAFLSKDKVELSQRSIEPLLQPDKFDVFWVDGSVTEEGKTFLFEEGRPVTKIFTDVLGGPDAAIVFALTEMLKHDYEFVGLHEQDVLLHPDWWGPTFSLFERGRQEGLEVGAVSARCYEDRLLVQKDGFGLVHNLGSGEVLFTREAARLILDNYRTGYTTDNRFTFCQLSGIDIGQYWAFRGSENPITADWHFDTILARHGLASLALTPSLATMLDQDIASQGLKMADGRYDLLRNEKAFDTFSNRTARIRGKAWEPLGSRIQHVGGAYTYFPHQIPGIGGTYSGDWRLKWCQGFGPFVWEAGDGVAHRVAAAFAERDNQVQGHYGALEVPILGPCEVLLGGQGKARVTDTHSGYSIDTSPADAGQGILQVPVPSGVSYRTVRVEALAPGVAFYGIRAREPQPWLTGYRFDHTQLPKVAE
jgi:hypothetical protein